MMSRSGGGRLGRRRDGRAVSWVPKQGAADSPQLDIDGEGIARSARQKRRAAEAEARRNKKR